MEIIKSKIIKRIQNSITQLKSVIEKQGRILHYFGKARRIDLKNDILLKLGSRYDSHFKLTKDISIFSDNDNIITLSCEYFDIKIYPTKMIFIHNYGYIVNYNNLDLQSLLNKFDIKVNDSRLFQVSDQYKNGELADYTNLNIGKIREYQKENLKHLDELKSMLSDFKNKIEINYFDDIHYKHYSFDIFEGDVKYKNTFGYYTKKLISKYFSIYKHSEKTVRQITNYDVEYELIPGYTRIIFNKDFIITFEDKIYFNFFLEFLKDLDLYNDEIRFYFEMNDGSFLEEINIPNYTALLY
ncbi:MAG: hypothetical protein LBM02_09795 [Lachnospiraceae bacterium]|jgi:hypothetical protein|nr:hypothetical protein [Lachnospiraceae bacterium]